MLFCFSFPLLAFVSSVFSTKGQFFFFVRTKRLQRGVERDKDTHAGTATTKEARARQIIEQSNVHTQPRRDGLRQAEAKVRGAAGGPGRRSGIACLYLCVYKYVF